MDASLPAVPHSEAFVCSYNSGKSNRQWNSGKGTNTPLYTDTDKIVGTPSIIKEEVKDKIKAQARKSIVFTSQSILLITVFALLINEFRQNTHPHNGISQINNHRTAHRRFCHTGR